MKSTKRRQKDGCEVAERHTMARLAVGRKTRGRTLGLNIEQEELFDTANDLER